MKRNYLQNIEIVGAVMVYKEGEQCRWSINWLIDNCDRVLIMLDNYNQETKKIILEYKSKYPKQVYIVYSGIIVNERINKVQGQIKRRFKLRQAEIREVALKEIRKLHNKKPIDLLIFPDSDEIFIDEFPKYLVEFWENQPNHDHMMLGFVEVFESMQIIMSQRMAPHGRIYKYKPEMTVYPWRGRTRYNPYYLEKKPWKVRNIIVHICHLTKEYRERRQWFDNADYKTRCERQLWFLPKDIRRMTAKEIADFQPGFRQSPSKYPSIPLEEYLNNKDKYINKLNLQLWSQH